MKKSFECSIRQLFTGVDNETLDLGRVLWAITMLVYCGLSIAHLITSDQFDAQSWAIGAGAILAGGGGGIALKANTEPTVKVKTESID